MKSTGNVLPRCLSIGSLLLPCKTSHAVLMPRCSRSAHEIPLPKLRLPSRICYTLSIVFTMVRLREYRRLLLNTKKSERPGHVELTIEVQSPYAVERISSTSSFRSPAYPSENLRSPERHIISDFSIPVTHRPRSSQETSLSSCTAPEMFLVPDGFRLSDEPPAYASRPPSLYS